MGVAGEGSGQIKRGQRLTSDVQPLRRVPQPTQNRSCKGKPK